MRNFLVFFFLFVFSSACAQSTTPKVYALVVGVSKYTDPNIPSLKFAERDALAFADFLKSPQAGSVPPQNMSVLTNAQATRSAIMRDLVQLIARSGPEDLFIFFFSGHGKNDQLENSGYMLTYDSENENEAGTAISMDDINSKIGKSKAKMKVAYIDACHAGYFKTGGAKGTAVDNAEILSAYMSGLANASGGNVAFMASTARQQSMEDEKLSHGVFTYYLLQGLAGAADVEQKNASGYNNGIVTISELQTYLSRQIEEATKYKQKPSVEGVFDSDFPLSVVKKDVSLNTEITKRPKNEVKKSEERIIPVSDIKVPVDELLPNGMAWASQMCYGQYGFLNGTSTPITLYKIKTQNPGGVGYGGVMDIDLKIPPGDMILTPKLFVYQMGTPRSVENCNDLFDDYKFYIYKEVNGKRYYAEILANVESRKRKHKLLSERNLNFSAKEPMMP
ncbi:MAG: caspase family protein [Chitinophagaceae bacterium]